MRFVMLVIPKGYAAAAPGAMPDAKLVEKMMAYNRSLANAGVLLGLEGLHPPSTGARLIFSGGKPRAIDGAPADGGEVVGGYWMIQVQSKAEAIEWAARAPMPDGDVIEIRQVQEMSDFRSDVREAAAGFPELQKQSAERK